MSIFNFVMDEVQDVVTRIVNEVAKVQEIQDGIQSGVNAMVGDTWKGEGANAFREEVMTRLIPEIAALIASIGGYQLNIDKARDRIVDGDSTAAKAIGNLVSVFETINI